MGVCDLPGATLGCAVAGRMVGPAAGSVFDATAVAMAEGFAKAAQLVVTFWTAVPVPGLSTQSGPVAELRAGTGWLTAALAVLSLLVAAGKTALTRSGRPLGEAARGLALLILATGAGVVAVNALVTFGDAYSAWVLDRATGGQLGARLARLTTIGGDVGLGSALLLVVGLLGIVASLAQIGLLIVRIGVVTVFTGVLPLAAAASGTPTGMAWLQRLLSWLLAFVLYKPAAATVYAAAFLLVGDGADAVSVLSGLFLLILSVVALPALLRLLAPAVGAATSGGGGAGMTAVMVLATGARLLPNVGAAAGLAASGAAGAAGPVARGATGLGGGR